MTPPRMGPANSPKDDAALFTAEMKSSFSLPAWVKYEYIKGTTATTTNANPIPKKTKPSTWSIQAPTRVHGSPSRKGAGPKQRKPRTISVRPVKMDCL